jgi:hypothetical protein
MKTRMTAVMLAMSMRRRKTENERTYTGVISGNAIIYDDQDSAVAEGNCNQRLLVAVITL